MIEQMDTRDSRYISLINKVNEIIDEVNSIRMEFEASVLNFDNHTHVYLGVPEEDNKVSYPVITMVDEREDATNT